MFFIKKILIILSIIILICISNKESENITIPDEAIRVRIIANSNSLEDQLEKLNVKNSIEKELYSSVNKVNNISEARANVNDVIGNLKKQINKIYSKDYDINYGLNYFPQKELYGIKYKEGMYESLVITLGEGKGENWWCVLFPPLCTINVIDNNNANIEYKSKVLEILNEYK